MLYALQRVEGNIDEPVTLAEAKAQCRVDIDDDDGLIANLVTLAREAIEARMRWAIASQTFDMYLDDWFETPLNMPMPPLASVTSIKYTDEDGNQSTWSSSNYLVDTASKPGRIVVKNNINFPSVDLQEVNGVVIRFVCGFADRNDVPMLLKQAILLTVGHYYENRENVIVGQGIAALPLPHGAESLCWAAGRNLRF